MIRMGTAITQYRYDGQDQLVSLTDPKGLTTTYSYDELGSLLEVQSPDTGTTTMNYNSAGYLKTHTDARGVTVTYRYDALNRQTLIDSPAPWRMSTSAMTRARMDWGGSPRGSMRAAPQATPIIYGACLNPSPPPATD
jgi:YD repeat-containing protein